MSAEILGRLRSGYGPAQCWTCGEWGCANAAGQAVPMLCACEDDGCRCHETFDNECSCDCHSWCGIVREGADVIERLTAETEALRAERDAAAVAADRWRSVAFDLASQLGHVEYADTTYADRVAAATEPAAHPDVS